MRFSVRKVYDAEWFPGTGVLDVQGAGRFELLDHYMG